MKIRVFGFKFLSGGAPRAVDPKSSQVPPGWSSEEVVRVAPLYGTPASPSNLANVVTSSRPVKRAGRNGS
jgi:hypothetical protein